MSEAQRLHDAQILGGAVPATVEEKRAAAMRSGRLDLVIGAMFEAEGVNRPAPLGPPVAPAPAGSSTAQRDERGEARRQRLAEMSQAQRDALREELDEASFAGAGVGEDEVDPDVFGYDPSHGEGDDADVPFAEIVANLGEPHFDEAA